MTMDIEDYATSFRPDIIDAVSGWCQGATFAKILTLTDVFEVGSLALCSIPSATTGGLPHTSDSPVPISIVLARSSLQLFELNIVMEVLGHQDLQGCCPLRHVQSSNDSWAWCSQDAGQAVELVNVCNLCAQTQACLSALANLYTGGTSDLLPLTIMNSLS